MPEPDFRPRTAREALLEIRRISADSAVNASTPQENCRRIDRIAARGLAERGLADLEDADRLADYLAHAHSTLRRIDETAAIVTNLPDLARDVKNCLVLPPDLEATVERREAEQRRREGIHA